MMKGKCCTDSTNMRAEVLTRCWHKDQHLLANWVRSDNVQGGHFPGLEGGGADDDAAGPEGGGAATQGEGGDSWAGQAEQSTVIEELEELPDQGQETEREGLPTPGEPDIIGPVTRSRRKLMNPKC